MCDYEVQSSIQRVRMLIVYTFNDLTHGIINYSNPHLKSNQIQTFLGAVHLLVLLLLAAVQSASEECLYHCHRGVQKMAGKMAVQMVHLLVLTLLAAMQSTSKEYHYHCHR